MKKQINKLCVLLVILLAIPLKSFSIGEKFMIIDDQSHMLFFEITTLETAKVIKPSDYKPVYYEYNDSEYIIPEKVNFQDSEYTVTEIGYGAFANSIEVERLDLPSTISQIDAYAFYNISKLNFITLRNPNPKSINLASDILTNLETYKCTIAVPTDVISKYKDSDWGVLDITFIMDDTETKYTENGIVYTLDTTSQTYKITGFDPNLPLDVIIPPKYNNLTVKQIGNGAFKGAGIKSLIIPNSISTIAINAFENCSALEFIKFPQNPEFTKIPQAACLNCSNLREIHIPQNITEIAYMSFHGCNNIDIIICNSNNLISYKKNIDYSFTSKVKNVVTVNPDDVINWVKADNVYENRFISEDYETLSLDDKSTCCNISGRNIRKKEVTYTREIPNSWVELPSLPFLPLYLPYHMLKADLLSTTSLGQDCEIAELESIKATREGTVYNITLNWKDVQTELLNANTPYIVRPNKTAIRKSGNEDNNIIVLNANNPVIDSKTETVNGNFQDNGCTLTLTGVYLPEQLTKGNGKYVLTKNNSFQQAGSDLVLNPYRFYLSFTTPTGQAKIKMNVDGEENQDALESIFYTEGEGDNIYYDLNGRRVDNPSNGIFITNGKKVLF